MNEEYYFILLLNFYFMQMGEGRYTLTDNINEDLPDFKLNEILSDGLCDTTVDLAIDYAEISFDSLVNEIAEEIPFIKTIVSLGKAGLAVREMHFAKKILTFLKEFHSENLNQKKRNEFRKNMNSNIEYRNKVTNQIIVFIDRLVSKRKVKILSRLLIAHIDKEYDWSTFIDLSNCLDSMFLLDFDVLDVLYYEDSIKIENISIQEKEVDKYIILASIERLKTFGFIASKESTWESVADKLKEEIFLNGFGEKFYNLCLRE